MKQRVAGIIFNRPRPKGSLPINWATVTERRCPVCRATKPVAEFHIDNHRGVGGARHPICRACRNQRAAAARTRRRLSLPMQKILRDELMRHGPRSTHQLFLAVLEGLRPDADDIAPVNIARQMQRLVDDGDVIRRPIRKNSLWTLYGDPRPWRRDPVRRAAPVGIGMDAEHLAWMAEQQARAKKRTQRGGCQGMAAAVLNQRGAP